MTTQDPVPSISVVIPVYNASSYVPGLLKAIFSQKPVKPQEVILIDSLSTDNTRSLARTWPRVNVIPIEHFSHGRARNLGAKMAEGDIVIMLTQDALPRDDSWLAKLIQPLQDKKVGAVYSRQVPRTNAPPTEKFFLNYHFPPGKPLRRTKQGSDPLSFEDVFFSNVSAAIRRELLLKYPFDESLIMSEDQQFARDLLDAGYAIIYQPDSAVIHSHNYSLKTAFKRYFDSVYSLTLIFPQHKLGTSASIGGRYLRREILYILRHHFLYFPYYCFYTMAKLSAGFTAHFADKLPRCILKKISLHSYHWEDNHSASD